MVLTVWRLKHPLSFPAPVVAFPKRVEIWIVFSTPFRADYREPAFQWPPCFMVVSGTSYQRGGIGGARISCVLYLCNPLFQPNTKGEAWLNPFCFLLCFLCAYAHGRVHIYSSTRMSRLRFSVCLVYWCASECGCWYVWILHLFFSLAHQCIVSVTRKRAQDRPMCRGGGL